MKNRLVFLAIGIVLSLSAATTRLSAQCHTCEPICEANAHMDFCGTAFYGFSSNCIPNYCHFGSCFVVHYFNCGAFADLTSAEIDRVVKAAAEGDAEHLRIYLLSSDQVSLNVERKALQIGGCNGEILASVSLSSDVFSKLEELTPLIALKASRLDPERLGTIAAVLPR